MDNRPAILLSSAGRRVELWSLFERAIEDLELPWRVIGADASALTPTGLAKGPVHLVPPASAATFHDAISELATAENVRLIVPTNDLELGVYASASFRELVAISSSETIAVTRDKVRFANWASGAGLPIPVTIPVKQVTEEALAASGSRFIVKQQFGSSSVGLKHDLDTSAVLALRSTANAESLIVQVQLSGPEYTVNCFADENGRCRIAVPHQRLRVRDGEVSHGRTVRDPDVEALARRVIDALPDARGALCVQIMRDRQSGLRVIEVNARFGGGYPLAHRAGARFPHWLVARVAGLPVEFGAAEWEAGWEMLRYDQSAFTRIDLRAADGG